MCVPCSPRDRYVATIARLRRTAPCAERGRSPAAIRFWGCPGRGRAPCRGRPARARCPRDEPAASAPGCRESNHRGQLTVPVPTTPDLDRIRFGVRPECAKAHGAALILANVRIEHIGAPRTNSSDTPWGEPFPLSYCIGGAGQIHRETCRSLGGVVGGYHSGGAGHRMRRRRE
jgi:hypothetical protein